MLETECRSRLTCPSSQQRRSFEGGDLGRVLVDPDPDGGAALYGKARQGPIEQKEKEKEP
jgi:hypothetical protein